MDYTIIQPCEALREFISHFWVGTWDASRSPHSTYYVVAGSVTEWVFAFDHPHTDLLFSAVQGHTALPGRFPVAGFRHLIGVAFYAHAIPSLFRMPASDLNGEFMSLDAFLGSDGNRLNERMALAGSTQKRIRLLTEYLLSVLRKQPRQDRLMVDAIKRMKSGGGTNIEALARDFHLSPKQFGRRFKECSGFSPKMYSRILRFESVIRHYPASGSLTEMAHAHGYYDQAHFIREFRSFTGYAPGEFRRIGEEGC